jgi:hypothetical protein
VVVEAVRPRRPSGRGASWQACEEQRPRIQAWLDDDGLELTKVKDLLARRGVVVPYSTLHRFAGEELGYRRPDPTVPVADGEPGGELQIDFGRMGLMFDVESDRRRTVWALIFTAVVSRHMFVWLSFRQTLEDVIAGCEAAWEFFDGVFAVIVPDNLKAIVDQADPCNPRINPTFLEYAQARGFLIDPARVRKPTDKALASHCRDHQNAQPRPARHLPALDRQQPPPTTAHQRPAHPHPQHHPNHRRMGGPKLTEKCGTRALGGRPRLLSGGVSGSW